MDLTEAKRLLTEREHSRGGRIDIRYGIQEGLAKQVPGLVVEVERLRGELADAMKSKEDIQDLLSDMVESEPCPKHGWDHLSICSRSDGDAYCGRILCMECYPMGCHCIE